LVLNGPNKGTEKAHKTKSSEQHGHIAVTITMSDAGIVGQVVARRRANARLFLAVD
jgi:hypothetical protein